MKYSGVLLLVLGILSGCGYHLGSSSLAREYKTFYIPYAKGDNQGVFTQALIHRMSTSSPLRYCHDGADVEIKVCLSAPKQNNIGFIYARSRPNTPNVTTANEGRLTQSATVSVVDCSRGCTIMGPTEITAFLEYDFDSDMTVINRHTFSLGQLEMNPLAKDAATPSLYGLLAEKIVDYVNHS